MATAAARTLRVISFAEGLSYIGLMGIAMPLKYVANMPFAVRVMGSLHGLLFVLFAAALTWAWWSDPRATRVMLGKVFTASIVPLGMIWADRLIHRTLIDPAEAAAPTVQDAASSASA